MESNLLSYELTLQMFNGRSYSLNNKRDPNDVVEIIKEPDRLVFRVSTARPPGLLAKARQSLLFERLG